MLSPLKTEALWRRAITSRLGWRHVPGCGVLATCAGADEDADVGVGADTWVRPGAETGAAAGLDATPICRPGVPGVENRGAREAEAEAGLWRANVVDMIVQVSEVAELR